MKRLRAALMEYSASVAPAFLQGQMRLTDESVKAFAQIKGFQVAMTPLLFWR